MSQMDSEELTKWMEELKKQIGFNYLSVMEEIDQTNLYAHPLLEDEKELKNWDRTSLEKFPSGKEFEIIRNWLEEAWSDTQDVE
jgi:hypothetical protein